MVQDGSFVPGAPDFGPHVEELIATGGFADTPEMRSRLKFELECGWADYEDERQYSEPPSKLLNDIESSVKKTRALLLKLEKYGSTRNIIFDYCIVGDGTIAVVTGQDLYAKGYSLPRHPPPPKSLFVRLPPGGSMAVINREQILTRLLMDCARRKPGRKKLKKPKGMRGRRRENDKRLIVARAASFFRDYSREKPTSYFDGPLVKFCRRFFEVATGKLLTPSGLEKIIKQAVKEPRFGTEMAQKKTFGSSTD
jgi:hypothetical protein